MSLVKDQQMNLISEAFYVYINFKTQMELSLKVILLFGCYKNVFSYFRHCIALFCRIRHCCPYRQIQIIGYRIKNTYLSVVLSTVQRKITEIVQVLKLAKKTSKDDDMTHLRLVLLGIAIVGGIGFIIKLIAEFLTFSGKNQILLY